MISDDIKIRGQRHLMCAEGSHKDKPDLEDIKAFLEEKGFRSRGLYLWYDDVKLLWRWNCRIEYDR